MLLHHKIIKEMYKIVSDLMRDLAFMTLISIPQLFTNQFQVTCDIKQVFSIWMKFMKNALFTSSQLQIYRRYKNMKN